MVQLGERLNDKSVLINFCISVINSAKPGSADYGAALCVICYQTLESGCVSIEEICALTDSINKYGKSYNPENIHAYRWDISLHYVAARLLLLFGNQDDALATFKTCAEMDVLKFSPLLALKTISARIYSGLILAGKDKIEEARKQFLLGIQEANRALTSNWANVIGSNENPLSFGMIEMAEVADLASQCVNALNALDREQSVPGYFWERINIKRFGIVEWTKSVEQENERLRTRTNIVVPEVA